MDKTLKQLLEMEEKKEKARLEIVLKHIQAGDYFFD